MDVAQGLLQRRESRAHLVTHRLARDVAGMQPLVDPPHALGADVLVPVDTRIQRRGDGSEVAVGGGLIGHEVSS